MKVITLTAPYSWLAAAQLKLWETRGWRTNERGLLGIHTAQSLGPIGGEDGLLALCQKPYFREAMIVMGIADPLAVPRGLIIAVCNLVDVRPVEDVRGQLDPAELAFGHYDDGRYAWKLTSVAVLRDPIRATGKQGLWNWAILRRAS